MKLIILFLLMISASILHAAKITDPTLYVGPKATDDFTILHKDGGYLKKIGSQGDWFFSKDGINEKKIGSGSGSGSGGINAFTVDDNPNAETGTDKWSNTGGAFTAITIGGNATEIIEGDQSFRFTASAQNDVVTGPILDFNLKKYHGISCELGVEYYGGDDNLELHVVDGNGDILNGDYPNNRKFLERSTRGPLSVSFQCPRAADITLDANKGNLHVEIKNVGASVAPEITWDLTYLGDNRNIGTTTLPNSISGRITNSGTPFLENTDSDEINNSHISKIGTGHIQIDYSHLGLENVPGFTHIGISGGSFRHQSVNEITNTYVRFYTYDTGSNPADNDVSFTLTKLGSDANKVVKTYKAIPVTGETENQFVFIVNPDGSVQSSTPNSGINIVKISTGDYEAQYGGLGLTKIPACVAKRIDAGYGDDAYIVGTTNLTRCIIQTVNTSTIADGKFIITITLQDEDYRKPQTKNISLAGIAVNSYAEQAQKQVRVESCSFYQIPKIAKTSLCGNWVDSVTSGNHSVGPWTVNIKPGTFSDEPDCVVGAKISSSNDYSAQISSLSSTAVTIQGRYSVASGEVGLDFNLICTGVK